MMQLRTFLAIAGLLPPLTSAGADVINVGPGDSIQAAIDIADDGDEIVVAPGTYVGSIDFLGRSIVLRSTDGPDVTTIQGDFSDVVTCTDSASAAIEGFSITGGEAKIGTERGIFIAGSTVTVSDCVIHGNDTGFSGSAIHVRQGSHVVVEDTEMYDNTTLGAGVVFTVGPDTDFYMIRCNLHHNHAAAIGGVGFSIGTRASVVNCRITDNTADFLIGAIVSDGELHVQNCLLANNEVFNNSPGPVVGGVSLAGGNGTISNCTIVDNTGAALKLESSSLVFVDNSIMWGNGGDEIVIITGAVTATHTNIEGGWFGDGNIDADPVFVQPGTGDYRLTIGSPCIDTGDDALLPDDEFDLDGDGNTSEPMPLDLADNPRVLAAAVDMGAYEGEFDAEPPADQANLDEGEFAVLIPEGGDFDPIELASVLFVNESGGDDATVTVTQFQADLHPGAGGFSEIGATLEMLTSLGDGEYQATITIPFELADLGGADPVDVNLTYYEPSVGNWALAVSANARVSPGFYTPIGTRSVTVGESWQLSNELGDYGVIWNPSEQRGFVWANVDHATDFAVGAALCRPDCAQPPDGLVAVRDMLVMFQRWGGGGGPGGPCDLNGDGNVDEVDFIELLDAWGECE